MMLDSSQQTLETRLLKDEPGFSFFAELFKRLNKERDLEKLEIIGGVRELAKTIRVDINFGIDTTHEGQERFSLEHRARVFGENLGATSKPKTSHTWGRAIIKNQFLIPLVFAALVTTILGLSFEEERANLGWIVSIGIWIVVSIIILTSVALDYQLLLNQGEMNRDKNVLYVTVVREGKEKLIKSSELLVGDILVLTKDVPIAADGLLFVDNDLFINEEVITGNNKPIKKKLVEDPFCRSGTEIANGSGKMLVTAVGVDSELGQTLRMVSSSTHCEDGRIHSMGRFFFTFNVAALCLGAITFIVLLIRWIVDNKGFPLDKITDEGPVQFLMLAMVVIVAEFPEGYFLSAFFRRIYLMRKFMDDKIHVRTLTENMMTVVKGWFQGTYYEHIPSVAALDPVTLELITENASLNSEAFLDIEEDGSIKFFRNQTECALLAMIKKFGVDYSEIRSQKRPYVIKNYGFNSDKKMSNVVIKHGDLLRLYNKGAAEIVLRKCTKYVDPSGSTNPISMVKRVELEDTIQTMASQGLRPLALTYSDLDPNHFNFSSNGEPLDESIRRKRGFAEAPDEDLVLLAIVGIEDPIREGVSELVEQFKQAGINVRMITGDSIDTAKQVASNCGILTNGRTMQGTKFRRRAEEDIEGLKRDLPQLQVLARSSPADKQNMVKLLRSIGERVAVFGDGTNDARALKESTSGIAMGTKCTEVAKEAADVVITNDHISSVLTFYLWSRRFALSFWGYVQFRSSVTLVVWIVVLVSVCVGGRTPLNVQQFLWANFVADMLVALTFALESAPEKVSDADDSYRVKSAYQDVAYWVHLFIQSLYQIIVILCTFYFLSSLFEWYSEDDRDVVKNRKNSLMFNIFIFMQLFNSLNSRKALEEYNIFEGILNSSLPCAIRLVTIGLHLLIMLTPVRTLFKVTELNAWEWLYSMVVSVMVIPLSNLIRYLFKSIAHAESLSD